MSKTVKNKNYTNITVNKPDIAARLVDLERRLAELENPRPPVAGKGSRGPSITDRLQALGRPLGPRNYWERGCLDDLALVRGYRVLENKDPRGIGGKYNVWSLKSIDPSKINDIDYQADTADEIVAFLKFHLVIRTGPYALRAEVQEARERLDTAAKLLAM